MTQLNSEVRAALERLIDHAKRDSGQSRRCADFLLAWWNAGSCGPFDLTTMWGCDQEIVADMALVFAWVGHNKNYPDTLGYEKDFEKIIAEWRPDLVGVKPPRTGDPDYDAGGRAFRNGMTIANIRWTMLSDVTKEALESFVRGYLNEERAHHGS